MSLMQRTTLFIWGSLGTAMIIYAFVAFVAKRPPGATPTEIPIVLVLGAVAGTTGLAALGVHGVLTSPERVLAFAKQAAGGRPESIAPAAWNRWRSMNIVAWALGESTVLLGLVGSFLKNDAMVIVPFLVFGLVIHVLMFPRYGALAAKLQEPR